MQVTVSIPDEFAAQAQAHGFTPESYILQWIHEQTVASRRPDSKPELSLADFHASLDALTRYSEKIPSLPIDSFSRESFYQDRD